MSKALKLDKGEQKATDILAKRIMPKTDFVKVIEHDKLYWNTLNQHFEFMVIKSDVLGKKAMEIIQNQTKESIAENIGLLCEWSEAKVKCLDLKGKLRIQEKLIDDKTTHFENVFMPQFNKEVKESKENWSETYKKSKDLLRKLGKEKDLDKRLEGLLHKIKFEHTWWDKTTSEDKENEEFLVQIYKPLKRLNSAYDKMVEEIEKENKYKV